MNQDWLDWDLPLGLFVVVDGMGGHNAGEVAAQLAVQEIRAFVTDSGATADITWPFGFETAQSLNANRLLTAVRLANRRIFADSCAHDVFDGMGTTVVAVLIEGVNATLVSVGDSRIYRWRAGRLEQLTSDDTWLAAVLGHADADKTESSHPLKHVLTRVVGTRDDLSPQAIEERLQPADRLVLCSDGVHGRLDSAAIAEIMARGGPADTLATALVSEALVRHTSDNATALVIAVD